MPRKMKIETGWMVLLRGTGPKPIDDEVKAFVEQLEAQGHKMVQPPHIEERAVKQLVDEDPPAPLPAASDPPELPAAPAPPVRAMLKK